MTERFTYLQVGRQWIAASTGFTLTRLECDISQNEPNPDDPVSFISSHGRMLLQWSRTLQGGTLEIWQAHFSSILAGEEFRPYHIYKATVTPDGKWTVENFVPLGPYQFRILETEFEEPNKLKAAAVDWNGGKLRFNSAIP